MQNIPKTRTSWRGWQAHRTSKPADWHLNTLIVCGNQRIVISSVAYKSFYTTRPKFALQYRWKYETSVYYSNGDTKDTPNLIDGYMPFGGIRKTEAGATKTHYRTNREVKKWLKATHTDQPKKSMSKSAISVS